MLAKAKLQTIICTTDLKTAKQFYEGSLGLPFKKMSEGAAVFDVMGADLRVSPVPELSPSEHTVVGFAVEQLSEVIQSLRNRGIVFEHFEGFSHDRNSIVTTPTGTKVAWFKDPDGNLLSIVEYKDR